MRSRSPARAIAGRRRKARGLCRAPIVRAAPSAALAVFLAACGTASMPQQPNYVEFTFEQAHPSGAPTEIVRVYAAVSKTAEIQQLDSVVRLGSGGIVTETVWNSASPNRQLVRDWTTCRQNTQRPPEAIPRTIMALETSILGPAHPPASATILSPDTWRIAQGIAIVTVHQLGPSIMNRTVSVGLPNKPPGTIISSAKLQEVAAIPDLATGWRACRSSTTS